jgi:hypothetical protein
VEDAKIFAILACDDDDIRSFDIGRLLGLGEIGR